MPPHHAKPGSETSKKRVASFHDLITPILPAEVRSVASGDVSLSDELPQLVEVPGRKYGYISSSGLLRELRRREQNRAQLRALRPAVSFSKFQISQGEHRAKHHSRADRFRNEGLGFSNLE